MTVHKINNAELNLTCNAMNPDLWDGTPGEISDEYALSVWFKDIVLETIDGVFTEFNIDNKKIVIDDLVINIGSVNHRMIKYEIPERLSRILNEELSQYVGREYADSEGSIVPSAINKELVECFIDAMNGRSLNLFFSKWALIKSYYSADLKNMLLKKLKEKSVRNTVSNCFSENIQDDIFHILEPKNAAFITLLLSDLPVAISRKNIANTNIGGAGVAKKINEQGADIISIIDKRVTRKHLVEFSLAYIVVERGSEFNKKTYMRSFLKNTAARDGCAYKDLSEQLRSIIKNCDLDNALKTGLLEVFGSEVEDLSIQDTISLKGKEYLFYEQMTPVFESGLKISDKQWDEWFYRIKTKHNNLLIRFFRDIQNSGDMLRNITFSLNDTCLMGIVNEYMRFAYKTAKVSYAQMTASIKEYAETSKDSSGFYYQVLNALLNNKIIDFELFHNTAIHSSENRKTNTLGEGEKNNLKSDDSENRHRLKDYLLSSSDIDLFNIDANALQKLVEEMLLTDPGLLKELLRDVFVLPQAVNKLVSALRESLLVRLLQLFNSSVYQIILPYTELLRMNLYEEEFGFNLSRIKNIIWENDIKFILKLEKSDNYESVVSQYLNHFISFLAAECNRTDRTVLSVVHAQLVLGRSDKNEIYTDILLSFIKSRKHENLLSDSPSVINYSDTNTRAENSTIENANTPAIDSLIKTACSVFNYKNWSLIEPHWEELKTVYSDELYSLFIQEAQKHQVRDHVVSAFPEFALYDLLQLLEPVKIREIRSVLSNYGKIYLAYHELKNKKSTVSSPPSSEKSIKKQLMGFTFGYLLVERGSKFNKRTYLRSLIGNIAAHNNLRYDDLVLSLYQSIYDSDLMPELKNEFLDALGVVSPACKPVTKVAADDEVDYMFSYASGYLCYKRIINLIDKKYKQNSKIGVSEWEHLFNKISQAGAHHSRRFLRELQVDSKMLNHLLHGLTVKSLYLCISSFMKLTGHVSDSDEHSLILTISQYGDRAKNKTRFYQFLLTALINNKVIDLKSFIDFSDDESKGVNDTKKNNTKENNTKENNTKENNTKENNTAASMDLSGESINKEIDIHTVKTKEKWQINIAEEINIVLNKSHSNTDKIIIFLSEVVKNKNILDEFCSIPEYKLCNFFFKLNKHIYADAISVAEYLRVASLSSQFQVSPADLSQVLWKSMSIYMQKSISNDDIHFVVDRYLQIYLSQLVETTGMSLDRIKQVVTQQLVLDSEDAPSLNTESLIIQIDSVSEYEIERAEHEISTLQVMHPDSEACSSEYIPADKAEQKIVELLFNEENKSFESGDTIAVGNAGMVLGAHYMPLLFERLELTQQGQFVNDESAFKAICLLRYLVYGEDSDKADDSLLSYIICGLQSGQTTPDREIIVDIELHELDKAMVDSLLGNIIQQWSALGKTSCNGLRETFLQREGLLTYLDDAGWRLNVNSSPFDVLLDRIPWSYSTIKYSFMPEVIQVDWRSGGNL